MDLNLKIFLWNCQGCVNRKFIRAFREYKVEHNPDIVCLVEPRVSGQKANFIIEQLGFNFSHWVDSVGFSGGILVLWKDSLRIRIIKNHPQFISLGVDNFIPNKYFLIFFVYGSPDRSKRISLWEGLKAFSPTQPIPWLIMGDFNAILSPEDKKSPYTIGKRCISFGKFDSCELQDIGFCGPPFTWQKGNTFVRLDRALPVLSPITDLFYYLLILSLRWIVEDCLDFLLGGRCITLFPTLLKKSGIYQVIWLFL